MGHKSDLVLIAEDPKAGKLRVARVFNTDRDFFISVGPEARAGAEHVHIHIFVNGQQRETTLATLMDDWEAPMVPSVRPKPR